jgi:hypothetical protein
VGTGDSTRPKGICPECGRVISGRAAGPAWVLLRSRSRDVTARHPVTCLARNGYRKVPRIRD